MSQERSSSTASGEVDHERRVVSHLQFIIFNQGLLTCADLTSDETCFALSSFLKKHCNIATTHPVQLHFCSCCCSADKLASSSVNLVNQLNGLKTLPGFASSISSSSILITVVIVITCYLSPLLLLLLNLFKTSLPSVHLDGQWLSIKSISRLSSCS